MQVLEIEELNVMNVARPLHWVLLFIPFYSVSKGVADLGTIYSLKETCYKFSDNLEIACFIYSSCCSKFNLLSINDISNC